MRGSGIDHVNIRIPENGVEEAVNFYQEVLGFDPMKLEEFRNGERTSFFFRISEDAAINIRLEENDVEILREGNPLGAKGRGPGIYIRDPFGYRIELKSEN